MNGVRRALEFDSTHIGRDRALRWGRRRATLASADVGSAEFLAPSGQGTGQQRATSFAGANLRGADLSDVDLDLATTTGADTTGAVMPKVESKASEPKPSAEPRRGGRRPGGPPIG